MVRFLTRRVLMGLLSLVIFLFALFIVVELAVPGDVATPLRLGATAQEVDEIREQIGVTRPLPVRFWDWLSSFVRGEFEITSFMTPEHNVFQALPSTLLVFVVGLALAYMLGSWLGRVTAWRGGAASGAVTVGGVVTYTIFPPFLAFLLTWGLGRRLHDVQRSLLESQEGLWRNTSLTPNDVIMRMIGVIAIVWVVLAVVRRVAQRRRQLRIPLLLLAPVALGMILAGFAWRGIWWWSIDLLMDAALPILGFTILSFGEFLLITQTGMGMSMGEDYVQTAQAKGLAPRQVRDGHVGRNASLVVTTRLAVSLPYLLTGLVIIERALDYGGVGSFMFFAIETQDLPAVMSGLALVGVLALAIRLFLDMASAWADPRIKDGLAEAISV